VYIRDLRFMLRLQAVPRGDEATGGSPMSMSADVGEWRRVAIHTLVRRRDDVVVGLHELGGAHAAATVSGRSGSRSFAQLAHWTGAETPLRLVSGTSDAAVLLDGRGSAVHLELARTAAERAAR
jgi:hypothetical protein